MTLRLQYIKQHAFQRTVFCSNRLPAGCLPRGAVSAQEVSPQRGVCLRGFCPEGCMPGVSARWVYTSPPPRGQNS